MRETTEIIVQEIVRRTFRDVTIVQLQSLLGNSPDEM